MERDEIVARLRAREGELRRGGILHLALFGSRARGDEAAESDVDLMADYDLTRRLTLFDKAGLEVEIAATLDAAVDLCDREFLEGPVRVRAEREAVVVF
jgi:uncharacterized protein